jgi:hypothetical protein
VGEFNKPDIQMDSSLKVIAIGTDASLELLHLIMKHSDKTIKWNSIQNFSNARRQCVFIHDFLSFQFLFDVPEEKEITRY